MKNHVPAFFQQWKDKARAARCEKRAEAENLARARHVVLDEEGRRMLERVIRIEERKTASYRKSATKIGLVTGLAGAAAFAGRATSIAAGFLAATCIMAREWGENAAKNKDLAAMRRDVDSPFFMHRLTARMNGMRKWTRRLCVAGFLMIGGGAMHEGKGGVRLMASGILVLAGAGIAANRRGAMKDIALRALEMDDARAMFRGVTNDFEKAARDFPSGPAGGPGGPAKPAPRPR